MLILEMVWRSVILSRQCSMGPLHHDMARPQVANGGDGLQTWRVVANISNKQSQTADKWWSS
jgi:hypothetical protein